MGRAQRYNRRGSPGCSCACPRFPRIGCPDCWRISATVFRRDEVLIASPDLEEPESAPALPLTSFRWNARAQRLGADGRRLPGGQRTCTATRCGAGAPAGCGCLRFAGRGDSCDGGQDPVGADLIVPSVLSRRARWSCNLGVSLSVDRALFAAKYRLPVADGRRDVAPDGGANRVR